jgi:hypothetical protein
MASDLMPGDRLIFDGQFAPCPDCQDEMTRYARHMGIVIEYRYFDSRGKAKKIPFGE